MSVDSHCEGECNVFRFTNTDTNEGHYGDRSLMVNTYTEGNDMWIDVYTDSTEDYSGHLNYFHSTSSYFTFMVKVSGEYRHVYVDG